MSAPARAEIGILGGSGLYAFDGLEAAREVRLTTPFGEPSDALVLGRLEGRPLRRMKCQVRTAPLGGLRCQSASMRW